MIKRVCVCVCVCVYSLVYGEKVDVYIGGFELDIT